MNVIRFCILYWIDDLVVKSCGMGAAQCAEEVIKQSFKCPAKAWIISFQGRESLLSFYKAIVTSRAFSVRFDGRFHML